jgi:hypothetical protein
MHYGMHHSLAVALPDNLLSLLVAYLAKALAVQSGIDLPASSDNDFTHHWPLTVGKHLATAAGPEGNCHRSVDNPLCLFQVEEVATMLIPGVLISQALDRPA